MNSTPDVAVDYHSISVCIIAAHEIHPSSPIFLPENNKKMHD